MIARTSITSHINATSCGLSTIHSTRSGEIFMSEFIHRQYRFTSTRNLLLESARKIDFLQQLLCWTFLGVLLFSSHFIIAGCYGMHGINSTLNNFFPYFSDRCQDGRYRCRNYSNSSFHHPARRG